MNRRETIYIAGPECFFENGDEFLASMRQISEARGHAVSLPNDTPLNLDHTDLQKNADEIFANLEEIIYDTTMIISDLDLFRSGEADSGTIFEIGMAYALGLKSYGHTRDNRPLVWKDQKITSDGLNIFDEHGNLHYYSFLPYSPMIMASTKLVQGTYEDAMNAYEADVYYGHDFGLKHEQRKEFTKNRVFVALRDYYDLEAMKINLEDIDRKNLEIVTPYFREYDGEESISEWLDELINENTKRIDESEYFIGDLNDYRGFESSNDVAFFSGYAFQTGKKMYGFMEDTRPMIEKIPNKLVDGRFVDIAKRNVENFDYPINLMFASSMKIVKGNVQEAITEITK